MQRIAASALALDRARSTASLAEALDRERFVARISARVRSELDIDELLRVAVERPAGTRGEPLPDPALSAAISDRAWQETGLKPVEAGGVSPFRTLR